MAPENEKRFSIFVTAVAIIADINLLGVGFFGCYYALSAGIENGKDQQRKEENCTSGKGRGDLVGHLDFVLLVISSYMILAGAMLFLAEVKLSMLWDRFGFLRSRLGRGIFSMLLGLLVIAEGIDFVRIEGVKYQLVFIVIAGSIVTASGLLETLSYLCMSSGSNIHGVQEREVKKKRARGGEILED